MTDVTRVPTITISDAPPPTPVVGDLWWDSGLGVEFIYYDDGNTIQWVTTQPSKYINLAEIKAQAAGDLAGYYPAPTIKPGVVLKSNPTLDATPPLGDEDLSIPTTAFVQQAIRQSATPPPPDTVYVVDTLAALKALTSRPLVVQMRGYFSAGDGGGGPPLSWVPGATTVADDFITVQPLAGPSGRYVRLLEDGGTVSPKWAGCGVRIVSFQGGISGTTLTTVGSLGLSAGDIIKGPDQILFNGSISDTTLTTVGNQKLPVGRLIYGAAVAFFASITGTTLTITRPVPGVTLPIGGVISSGASAPYIVAAGTTIVSADPNDSTKYTVSISQTIASVGMSIAILPNTTIVSADPVDLTKYTLSTSQTVLGPVAMVAQVLTPATSIVGPDPGGDPTKYVISPSQTVPAGQGATFLGTSAGTTSMTVSSVVGFINVGDVIVNSLFLFFPTSVVSQTSGTPGGAGVYVLNHTSTMALSPCVSGPALNAYKDDSVQFQKVFSFGHAVDASGATYCLKSMSVTGTNPCPGIFSDGSATFIPALGASPNGVSLISCGTLNGFYVRKLKFIAAIPVDPGIGSLDCDRFVSLSGTGGATASDYEVSDCSFIGANLAATIGGTVRNSRIERNFVKGTWCEGVTPGSSAISGFVTDNYLIDGGFCNGYRQPSGAIRTGLSNAFLGGVAVTISRNHIVRYSNPAGQSAIDCFAGGLRMVDISDNIIEDCGGTIEMKTDDNPTGANNYKSFTVSNNTIRLRPNLGVYGFGSTGITIFYTGAIAAAKAGNFKVSGNHIFCEVLPYNRLGIYGISVSGFDSMSIDGNMITNVNAGILFVGGVNLPTLTDTDYFITNNTIVATETAVQQATGAYTVNRLFINNNPMLQGGITSVSLSGGPINTFSIKDNYIWARSTYGIEMRDCHDGIVSDNVITAGTSAILSQGIPPSNVMIEKNRLRVYADPNDISAITVAASTTGPGLTNGIRTFTVTNGTGTVPTIFQALVANGSITGGISILQPGAYSVFPTGVGATLVSVDVGSVGSATFTMTPRTANYPVYPSAVGETGITVQNNSVDPTTDNNGTKALVGTVIPTAVGTVVSNNVRGTIVVNPNGVYPGSLGDVFYNGDLTSFSNDRWLCTTAGSLSTAVWKALGVPAATGRIVTAAGAVTMTAVDTEVILNKTVAAATTVTLPPSPTLGQLARVSDGKGDAGNPSFNISVQAAAGGTINGATGLLVMNVNWGTTLFRSMGGDVWSVL